MVKVRNRQLRLNSLFFVRSAEKGIVALITTIVVSLLLVIIASGAIAITAGDLRQAIDYDSSVKAYFAAETGAEDAIAVIRRGLKDGEALDELIKDNCPPYDNAYDNDDDVLNAEDNIAYTCQIVTTDANQLSDQLDAEESQQIDLTGASGFSTLQLSWNQRGSSDPQNWIKSNIPTLFPIGSDWNNKFPAVMEVTVISYPKSATFNSGDITSETIVLKPAPVAGDSTVALGGANKPELVNCNPSGTTGAYECSMDITGFNTLGVGARNYIIRLHARYSSATYQVEAQTGTGSNVLIPTAQLSIDSTGKANDVFRRVLLKVPLSGQSAGSYSILANDTICKVLDVSQTANIVTGGGEQACKSN